MMKRFIKRNFDEILMVYIISGVVVTLAGAIFFKDMNYLFGFLIHIVIVGIIISIYAPGGGYESSGR